MEPSTEPAPEPEPLPDHPILDESIRAARDAAQRRLLRPTETLQPDLLPLGEAPRPSANPRAPEALPGHFVPLELPPDADPLGPFEAALAELEAGTRETPVRLAFYGASGVAADKWTGYVRAYLQARFGDGGPGIVAGAPPHQWSTHLEVEFASSKGWTRHNSFQLGELDAPAPFGAMGQAMSASAGGAWTQIAPRGDAASARSLSHYEIHYLIQPGGGSFAVELDGRELEVVSTSAGADLQRSLGRHRVKLRPGKAQTLRLELRGDGQVWLLGVVAETGEPGVVLDTLGANGARTENQLRWDEQLWAAHLRERDPVLYVLAYGNNESVDEDLAIDEYEQQYAAVLDRFAAALPRAGCVMIGPGDYPIVDHGEVRPRPRLARIREVQRALAPAYGCAFLDTRAVFGGEGSKAAWVEAGLGKDDYLHLTRAGYLRFGMAVGDALVQRHDWRAQLSGLRAP